MVDLNCSPTSWLWCLFSIGHGGHLVLNQHIGIKNNYTKQKSTIVFINVVRLEITITIILTFLTILIHFYSDRFLLFQMHYVKKEVILMHIIAFLPLCPYLLLYLSCPDFHICHYPMATQINIHLIL